MEWIIILFVVFLVLGIGAPTSHGLTGDPTTLPEDRKSKK